MSQGTILVIDDSATIRRLVDSTLSPVGYTVVLAASAEEGMRQLAEVQPSLILLDHQLPGTTGTEVCRKLLASADWRDIPVIVSSTLRKRAYLEYAECPNVVDMLPKPYTTELLITTIANAVDTGSLVVDSQRQGTAVPEVMHDLAQVTLSGGFEHFSLREILDFLNNGEKQGLLEIELERNRIFIYLHQGRVQAVTASGIDPGAVTRLLPESLRDLAPVLKLTVGGGSCSQIEGLVQLLDNRVLDPRLLRKLLRHQAAVLLLHSFTHELRGFRFEAGRRSPALHDRLALDTSTVALLVEAALRCPEDELPESPPERMYGRRAIRGQNLDRAGLSPQHQKIMTYLAEPRSLTELAEQMSWETDEVRRVLYGLWLADLVDVQTRTAGHCAVVLETDPAMAHQLRELSSLAECSWNLKVVRDRLSLQLVLKRHRPDVLVVCVDSESSRRAVEEIRHMRTSDLSQTAWVAVGSEHAQPGEPPVEWAARVPRPYTASQLLDVLEEVRQAAAQAVGV